MTRVVQQLKTWKTSRYFAVKGLQATLAKTLNTVVALSPGNEATTYAIYRACSQNIFERTGATHPLKKRGEKR